MKLRLHTLWRVPVFCTLASIATYYLTLYFGGTIFGVQTVGANGVIELSVDPVRSALFHGVLFFAVLLLGGLWFFASMSRAELAVSSGILSAIYFAILLVQLYCPGLPISFGVFLAPFQNWTGTVSSWLLQITGHFTSSVLLSAFTPFLFVAFGRRQAK